MIAEMGKKPWEFRMIIGKDINDFLGKRCLLFFIWPGQKLLFFYRGIKKKRLRLKNAVVDHFGEFFHTQPKKKKKV